MVTPMTRHRPRPRAAAVSEIQLAPRRGARLQPPPEGEEPAVPRHFLCPISLELMRDPVTGPTGITYDRRSVEAWLLDRGRATCPVTGRPLRAEELVPNHATRRVIQDWCVAHRAMGVERVPTPRVPVSPADAADLLAAVVDAADRGDGPTCRRLAAKARALGKESERNRRCLASAGAAQTLASAFSQLALTASSSGGGGALEEILAALVVFFPLDAGSRTRIASPASLNALVSILMSHSCEVAPRVSAGVVLREIASSSDAQCLDAMSKTSGIHDALVNLVKKPVSPQATKAALVTAYYLVATTSDSDFAASQLFVALGMVRLLVELLVDADKGTTEKALAVLDSLLLTEGGRVAARGHALAVPVLVKKMRDVSEMATEFAVSALWRLCNGSNNNKAAEEEALQVGAFQKLLLLLQVGCMGVTKDRASELLRLLNGSRGGGECIETVDFKGLKRPF
ncbi:hypothetical protein PR202_gb09762 [Eleusine coracana subsp. coracana]|uniref:U-box domain-containing protein n=1 Tax=Eleusine coracana subsp. coracana TaxID=191504 RepID=A0AAV5EFS1_ELECO|nr:hypothetical protein PR202_gb09762 [Eleusine coracana subsp. coracana]